VKRAVYAAGILFACAMVLVMGAGPIVLRAGIRRPPSGTPADHELRFEPVDFQPPDRSLSLSAWWMPAPNPKAAIILVHGGGDNKSEPYGVPEDRPFAGQLIAHGYSVLALDLRNHGESGDAVDDQVTGGVEESEDVIGAVNYLSRRFPPLRYGALGFSMGGETVFYAAAKDGRIEAVAEEGAYAELGSVIPNWARAVTGLPLPILAPVLWSWEHVYGAPFRRARAVDVIGSLRSRPVLLIHAESDPIVPVEHCRRLSAADPSAEVWIVPTHPLSATNEPWGMHAQVYRYDPDEFVKRVTDFFDRVFAPDR
jgi:alpha-beta hydrolase superfamily lysophospholipase